MFLAFTSSCTSQTPIVQDFFSIIEYYTNDTKNAPDPLCVILKKEDISNCRTSYSAENKTNPIQLICGHCQNIISVPGLYPVAIVILSYVYNQDILTTKYTDQPYNEPPAF